MRHWITILIIGYLLIGFGLAIKALSAIGSLSFSGVWGQIGNILLWPVNLSNNSEN